MKNYFLVLLNFIHRIKFMEYQANFAPVISMLSSDFQLAHWYRFQEKIYLTKRSPNFVRWFFTFGIQHFF